MSNYGKFMWVVFGTMIGYQMLKPASPPIPQETPPSNTEFGQMVRNTPNIDIKWNVGLPQIGARDGYWTVRQGQYIWAFDKQGNKIQIVLPDGTRTI